MPWPMICFAMCFVSSGSSRLLGLRSRSSGTGSSVAKARDANVSMMVLTFFFFFFAAKAVRWMHFVITPKMVSASTIRDRPFQGVQLDAFFEVFKEVGAGCCRQ
jgi:hypothetical protein